MRDLRKIKIKNIVAAVCLLALFCLLAAFASGCVSAGVGKLTKYEGKLASDESVSRFFESGSVKYEGGTVRIALNYREGVMFIADFFYNPTYNIANQKLHSAQSDSQNASGNYIDGDIEDEYGDLHRFYCDQNSFVIEDVRIRDFVVDGETSSGSYVVKLTFTANGGTKQNDTPHGASHEAFEKIKQNYRNAGYSVDVEEDAAGEYLSLIQSTKATYGKLGYEMSVIAKNLDNLNVEMYFLFATDSKAEADKIAEAYDGAYSYAQNENYIIVSVWPLATPNYMPFFQAM